MPGQTVAIYRNRRTGVIRVQPCARAGGIPQEFGPAVMLPAEVDGERLLKAVLDNLPKTDEQQYIQGLAPKYSREEYSRILKEDQLVHVERSGGEFKIVPSTRMRNSFGSIDEMTKRVPDTEFLSVGGDLLREMFRVLERTR